MDIYFPSIYPVFLFTTWKIGYNLVRDRRCIDLKMGLNYLLYEERPDDSFKLIEKLSKEHPALCITTIYPAKLRKMYDLDDTAIVWLTDSEGGEDTVRPERLDFELSRGVMNFLTENSGCVVLIEGCEYLMLENDFKNVKKFFKRINDLASVNESTVIVTMSPEAFDRETVAAFSKDFDMSCDPVELLGEAVPEKVAEPEVKTAKSEPQTVKSPTPTVTPKPESTTVPSTSTIKSSPQDIATLQSSADDHMRRKQFHHAIELYDKIISLQPENTRVLFNKAICLQMSNRLAEAVGVYDRLLGNNPRDIDCLINKGLALRKMGDMMGAVETYEKAGEINPYDSTVWNNLGIAFKSMGRWEEAIESYDKGLSAKPNDAGLWSNKGVALKEAGKLDEAMECYNKALSIDPNRASTRRNKELLEEEMKTR